MSGEELYALGRHLYRVRPTQSGGRGPYLHKLVYDEWVYLGRRYVDGVRALGTRVSDPGLTV